MTRRWTDCLFFNISDSNGSIFSLKKDQPKWTQIDQSSFNNVKTQKEFQWQDPLEWKWLELEHRFWVMLEYWTMSWEHRRKIVFFLVFVLWLFFSWETKNCGGASACFIWNITHRSRCIYRDFSRGKKKQRLQTEWVFLFFSTATCQQVISKRIE